jgi:hypothetical protein
MRLTPHAHPLRIAAMLGTPVERIAAIRKAVIEAWRKGHALCPEWSGGKQGAG